MLSPRIDSISDNRKSFLHAPKLALIVALFGALAVVCASAQAQENVMQIKANMVVDTPEELLALVDRAKAKGANVVKFADTKLNRFGLGESPGELWEDRMREFVDGVKARDMELILNTVTIGYCSSLIASNTNLASGYPVVDQQLRRVGDNLVPIKSSNLANGGFEQAAGNTPEDWNFQDAAGIRTFIDTSVKRSGNASFRSEARDGESSRVSTTFDVKPFHQYTLKFWVRAENLTAANLLAVVRDDNDKTRTLTNQRFSTERDNGGRAYFNRPNDLSLGWTQMKLAFNSLDATRVNLGLSVFGGQNGRVWFDDVSVQDTPSLNWLVRDDLPTAVRNQSSGRDLQFGSDVTPIVDNKLGDVPFPGSFETYHAPPAIKVASNANIDEGDIVSLSGYHALVTFNGQTSCSWNNENVFARMKQVHQTLQAEYQPSGFLLNYDEIRTGGYEPSDVDNFANSGAALAASIERAYNDLFEVAPNAKHYFWSDMVDPFHNAIANYYQINNTLDGSWLTLDPSRVILVTWWEGQKITNNGPNSLKFFSDLGFKQVLGAFYDADVEDNFNRWQEAAEGVSGIIGGMYATWTSPPNYSQIEAFGDLWWQGALGESDTIDELNDFTFNQTLLPGNTYTISVPYQASRARDMALSLQNTDDGWSTQGFARVQVDSGDGVANFSITVSQTAAEGDAYALTAYLMPTGGQWDTRLDHISLMDLRMNQANSGGTSD